MKIAIIGGGAAGFFAAITAAEKSKTAKTVIFESTGNPLAKVLISGGGRCNVTHNCFKPSELVKNYPRGNKELLSSFNKFQPQDTIEWFEKRGVQLKAEPDGRIFPVSNKSSTIVDTLLNSVVSAGVELKLNAKVKVVNYITDKITQQFEIITASGESEYYDRVLLATGGSKDGFVLAKKLGLRIIPPVPSLFSFNIDDSRLQGLAGTSINNVKLTLLVDGGKQFKEEGSLLITHWGLSGPSVLRLSSLAARKLSEQAYQADLVINFLPHSNREAIIERFLNFSKQHGRKKIVSHGFDNIPKKYWKKVVEQSGINSNITWANLTRQGIQSLAGELSTAKFKTIGKSTNKEEFVTCGGIDLREINFMNMQSKKNPNLFAAGELLNIDALTGGFNFQNAWTSGWIAGQHIVD